MVQLDVDPQILLFLIFEQVSSDYNVKPVSGTTIKSNEINNTKWNQINEMYNNTFISSLRGCYHKTKPRQENESLVPNQTPDLKLV